MTELKNKSLKIKFLKQSAFLLEYEGSRLITDPGSKKHSDLKVDYIYATHNHLDHIGGIKGIMKNNSNTKLICNKDVAKNFRKDEEITKRIIVCYHDEDIKEGPWNFQFIKGRHGIFRSTLNLMVIITADNGESFGHAGDSVTIDAFKNKKLDYLAVPIGGLFTASPKKILKELVEFDKPFPKILPMHWILRNPEKFCKKLKQRFPDAICIIP